MDRKDGAIIADGEAGDKVPPRYERTVMVRHHQLIFILGLVLVGIEITAG